MSCSSGSPGHGPILGVGTLISFQKPAPGDIRSARGPARCWLGSLRHNGRWFLRPSPLGGWTTRRSWGERAQLCVRMLFIHTPYSSPVVFGVLATSTLHLPLNLIVLSLLCPVDLDPARLASAARRRQAQRCSRGQTKHRVSCPRWAVLDSLRSLVRDHPEFGLVPLAALPGIMTDHLRSSLLQLAVSRTEAF